VASGLRILHAIHDFLPRHRAGSEIYAFELGRALAARHHVHVLCADYDPARTHGQVAWRVYDGLPVVEIVNNWACTSFADTYRPPVIGRVLAHVLDAVQPDVLHVHNLLNLSFDLPAMARASGAAVVATLHDYSLVCASGGQRLHQAEHHVCEVIDTERCARCFRQSPFYPQMSVARAVSPAPGAFGRLAVRVARRYPQLARSAAGAARHVAGLAVTGADMERRIDAAREVFQHVDLFVAPSASLATEVVALGLDSSKVQVSDYGFRELPPRPRSDRSGPLRIGFVGTLVWHKGVHVLLDAVRRLPPASFTLTICGNVNVVPDYTADLRRQADGLPVTFAGDFERDAIGAIYSQFDVLVVPSLWLENSPLVIHEAFMTGVPVVGSRLGGIPGLIDHGVNGLLFDPRSPEDLANALKQLIDQPSLLDQLASRAPAVKSIAQDADQWEAIYQAVLRRRQLRDAGETPREAALRS
jgi:glycosyltransferase involved in cell wall biosynthesis